MCVCVCVFLGWNSKKNYGVTSPNRDMKKPQTASSSTTVSDHKVPFPAFIVRTPSSKTFHRNFVATHGLVWLRLQHRRGARGAIMIDIDDTLLDGNERVKNGFELMKFLYDAASQLFPIHIVTARPDDCHDQVMKMLAERGFCIPVDRLHMLPAESYGKGSELVEEFKYKTFVKIARLHHGCVARFGDKLWDVADFSSLHTYLSHVDDAQTYIFLDPKLKGTASFQLQGLR